MKKQTRWLAVMALVAVAVVGVLFLGDAKSASGAQQATPAPSHASDTAPTVTVYKSPTCTCCTAWAEHLRDSGFRVELKVVADQGVLKEQHRIPAGFASCHTAEIAGYVLEGHVPADVIHQLLAEQPDVHGLTVPGMPAGVPGMPEVGPDRRPYQIFAMERSGGTPQVYATR